MSVTAADRETRDLDRQLGEMRAELHRLAVASQATERRTETLVEDLRRVRGELSDRLTTIWALILFQLSLGVISWTILVIHGLTR